MLSIHPSPAMKLKSRPRHYSSSCIRRPIALLSILNILLFLFFCFNALTNRRVSFFSNLHPVPVMQRRADWQHSSIPDFCNQIRQYPQPHTRNCSFTRPGAPRCIANKQQMFSQDGEDFYLYTRHFSHLKRPGIYVDIAANDAIDISNTYFLDRCLGWHGICAEANDKYYERLHRLRSCALIPTCISDVDGVEVKFALNGAVGGVVDTHKTARAVATGRVIKKKCVAMKTELKRFGITTIDYLNVDVEGHELNVLKGFDWDHVTIRVITVELSMNTRKEINDFLIGRGFRKHWSGSHDGFRMNDPIYLHESVEFGRPE